MIIKKDGSHRFCCDFLNLNKITRSIADQMTNKELLFLLGGVKYFITLDAKSGYWCIPLSEESKLKRVLPQVLE